MKNIYKRKINGILYYCYERVQKGKHLTKYFKSYQEAVNYRKTQREFEIMGISDFLEYPQELILDIRNALKILPRGVLLSDCVKSYANILIEPKSIFEAIEDWAKVKIGKATDKYIETSKNRILKFAKFVESFENATPDKIFDFLNKISDSKKTQNHYFSLIKEFFYYSTKKGYCINPFDKIHESETPTAKRKKLEIPTVAEIAEYFDKLKSKPDICGCFALVAFGGIRLAEAQRIEPKDINFDRKEILLSFDKTKTGDTWLQSQMPDNVWDWLKEFPPTEKWKHTHINELVKSIKPNHFPDNFLRHCFSCYHLSLHRNASKTSLLLRHRNPNTLWQNYLDTLVAEDVASSYFQIKP